jgi:hypothetical protein
MTGAWDLLYLINLACVFLSWKWATVAFNNDNKWGGYLNLFASALNAAIILNHFT